MFKAGRTIPTIIALLIIGQGLPVRAETTPRATVQRLYRMVIEKNLSGLPSRREVRWLRPLLSSSLLQLFERARKIQTDYVRRFPENKPPLIEGCLFSCSFEGPRQFKIDRVERPGRFMLVTVSQSDSKEANTFSWFDTVVLVRERGKWVVWDVEMGCDWPFRMGPTLRTMLSADP